jgi:hypothetical protein
LNQAVVFYFFNPVRVDAFAETFFQVLVHYSRNQFGGYINMGRQLMD